MSEFDVVVRDGIVVDGSGAQRYRVILANGGVTVEDDRGTATHSGLLLRHGTAPR
jgi:hypothetical protein